MMPEIEDYYSSNCSSSTTLDQKNDNSSPGHSLSEISYTSGYYTSLYEDSHTNLRLMVEIMDQEKLWNLYKNKDNIQLFKIVRELNPSECFIKRIVEINGEMDQVVELFEDRDFQLTVNTRLDSFELVNEISPETNITRQSTRKMLMVEAREFYTFTHRYQLDSNSVVIANHSIEHEDFPDLQNVTRGIIHSIFLFERISPTETKITNLLNVDLGGKIPAFISDIMANSNYKQVGN